MDRSIGYALSIWIPVRVICRTRGTQNTEHRQTISKSYIRPVPLPDNENPHVSNLSRVDVEVGFPSVFLGVPESQKDSNFAPCLRMI